MAGPGSSTIAPSPNSFMASCAFLMRALKSSMVCIFLSKRLIDRRALLGEHFRAVLGDVEAILQAHAEFAVNSDGWLVGVAHAGLDLRFVALHEIRPLMPVEPDPVPGA